MLPKPSEQLEGPWNPRLFAPGGWVGRRGSPGHFERPLKAEDAATLIKRREAAIPQRSTQQDILPAPAACKDCQTKAARMNLQQAARKGSPSYHMLDASALLPWQPKFGSDFARHYRIPKPQGQQMPALCQGFWKPK